MGRIVVTLPEDRDQYGTIHVEDNDGNVVAGPFTAYGRADNGTAMANGNGTRDPTQPYGDTPTGRYLPGGVVQTGSGNYPSSSYGPNGAIRLNPVGGDALIAQRNGRTGLLIHGGDPNASGGLRATNGCVRVENQHMAAIIEAYESTSSSNAGANMCMVGEVDVISSGPMSPGPPSTTGDADGTDPPSGFEGDDDGDDDDS